jgi:hypothetical protein
MKKQDLTHGQMIAVPCPTCGSPVGKGCVLYSDGQRFESHRARKLAAIDKLEEKWNPNSLIDVLLRKSMIDSASLDLKKQSHAKSLGGHMSKEQAVTVSKVGHQVEMVGQNGQFIIVDVNLLMQTVNLKASDEQGHVTRNVP